MRQFLFHWHGSVGLGAFAHSDNQIIHVFSGKEADEVAIFDEADNVGRHCPQFPAAGSQGKAGVVRNFRHFSGGAEGTCLSVIASHKRSGVVLM